MTDQYKPTGDRILVNDSVKTELLSEGEDRAYRFCELHNLELHNEIAHLGFSRRLKPEFGGDVEKAHLTAAHALFTLACNTVGTDAMAEFRCPICAFRGFDFAAEIANALSKE